MSQARERRKAWLHSHSASMAGLSLQELSRMRDSSSAWRRVSGSATTRLLGQLQGLVFLPQRVDDRVEVAFEHLVQGVQR